MSAAPRAGALIGAAAAAAVVAMCLAPAPRPARADELNRSFSASAVADGVRLRTTLRGYFAVEELADLGAPTAEASIGEVGSSALAGYPWPGENALAVLLLTGLPVPYPMVARSTTSGTRRSDVVAGPIVLSAESTEQDAHASAQAGFSSNGLAVGHTASTARTAHDPLTGESRSEATNVAQGVTIGDVLQLAAVRSEASVTADMDAEPKRRSELTITRAQIAGHAVSIGPQGITAEESSAPLPDGGAFAQVLAQAGVALEYVHEEKTADGVTAAGLRVTLTQEIPGAPEPARMVVELGRAHAAAQSGGRAPSALPGDPLAGSAPLAAAAGDQAPMASPSEVASTATPAVEKVPSAQPLGSAPSSPTTGLPASQSSLADRAGGLAVGPSARQFAEAPVRLLGAGGEAPLQWRGSTFYLVLAGGAVLLLGVAMAIRFFGERSSWTS